MIDHINRNPLDNRKCNLRVVTQLENTWNRGICKRNKSGVNGVYKHKNKWGVAINYKRKRIYLGLYETIEEAEKVRKEAEEKYYKIGG